MKLSSWWSSLTGSTGGPDSKNLAKVRRGGPWNRELELYYGLLEDSQVIAIDDEQALKYQANADELSNKVSILYH